MNASETVDALLAAAGLTVPEEERRAFAAGYAALRESTEALAAPWGLSAEEPGFTISASEHGTPGAPGAVARSDERTPRWWTVAQAGTALRNGQTTSAALVDGALARIDAEDGPIGAVVARFDDAARRAAAGADALLAAGTDLGPLHGVPLIVKDILTTVEGPTRAQSLVPTPYLDRREDAACVAALRRAGAVILCKASTSEFAIGAPDAHAGFPDTRNPWDTSRWPGGSSSGTGAAVSAGFVPAGLGTDTGGSVRIPAALCGITGLKTTYGRVPVTGCIPLGPGLDTIGPLARSAADCALVFDALVGARTAAGLDGDVRGLRVGLEVAHHLSAPGLDPAVPGRVAEVASVLAGLGAHVVEVDIHGYPALKTASLVQTYTEGFAVHRELLRSRWRDYGSRTRAVLGSGALYSSADYARALRVGVRGREMAASLFERLDVVVTPTVGMTAPRMDEDWWAGMLEVVFTTPWNVLGVPALTVPAGPGADGLPLGVQIIGRPGAEGTVLRVGDALQRATGWHLARPPVA